MDNIIDLMKTVTDETGVPLEFTLRMGRDGFWTARVTENGDLLCDRQGDRFLITTCDTPEDAVESLDHLCA